MDDPTTVYCFVLYHFCLFYSGRARDERREREIEKEWHAACNQTLHKKVENISLSAFFLIHVW